MSDDDVDLRAALERARLRRSGADARFSADAPPSVPASG